MSRRSWVVAVMIMSVSLLGFGCTSDELDAAHFEQSLGAQLEQRLGVVPPLDCSGVARGLGPGDAFSCDVQIGQVTVPVLVELGDSREVAAATVQARLLESAAIAELVGDRLSDELGPTTIDCGLPVVAAADGVISDCNAIDAAGTSRSLRLLVDERGAIEVSLGQ